MGGVRNFSMIRGRPKLRGTFTDAVYEIKKTTDLHLFAVAQWHGVLFYDDRFHVLCKGSVQHDTK